MTSKEALNKLIFNLRNNEDRDIESWKTNPELTEIIYKDLEVLEILKQYIGIYFPDARIKMFELTKNFTDYNIIKEWLDNE